MRNYQEILKLAVLFFVAIALRYFSNNIIFLIFQLVLLIQFYKTDKPYLWLAFVFIVESSPGAIFSMSDTPHTFSLLSGSGTGNLYFYIPFILISIFKVRSVKVDYPKYFLAGSIGILIFYFIFLLAGNGIYKWTAIVRLTLPWFLLYLVPRLLPKEEDYAKFFSLLFPFVFFVLVTQVYKLIYTDEFVTLIGGTGNLALAQWKDILDANAALRPAEGIFIPFLIIFGAIYFLTKKNQKYFRNNFLLLIIGLSSLSIFITATRAWLLAVLVLILGYSILVSKNPMKLAVKYSFPTFIIFLLFLIVPFLRLQADLAFARYETIGYLLQGDITAGGTLSRLSVRGPAVMQHFYQRPFFGWGYGTEGATFADGHVGHQNLLMQTGLVGYILFFSFWVIYILNMFQTNKLLGRSNQFYKLPIIMLLFFFAIHIINTSSQWFNYLTTYTNGFIFALLFGMSNMLYWEGRKAKQLKKIKTKSDFSISQ